MEKRNELPKNNTVLIIDDHPVFLEGFKAIIRRDGRFTIAGDARTGEEALVLAEHLDPDLVVTEIDLPDQDAFQVIDKTDGEGVRGEYSGSAWPGVIRPHLDWTISCEQLED